MYHGGRVMRYQTLIINNFRGIKNLEIEDLKLVNLLSGRNECGKTSILEALFLLSGMANPRLTVTIHNFRDLIMNNNEDFSYMFYNLNFDIPICLKGKLDNQDRDVTITPLYQDRNSQLMGNIK